MMTPVALLVQRLGGHMGQPGPDAPNIDRALIGDNGWMPPRRPELEEAIAAAP